MTKIVIAGTSVYGIKNQGDEAMLNVLCKEIQAGCPNIELVLLARHPSNELDRLHGVHSIKNIEHNSKAESMGRWFNGLNNGDSTDHLQNILKEIESADLLIIGGDPFAEISIGFNRGLAPYAALLITLAKFAGTPIMLYGIHMGRPLETEFGKEITKFCITNSDVVTLREEFSKNVLDNLGINTDNCIILADSAYGLEPINKVKEYIIAEENISFLSDRVLGVDFRHQYWIWGEEEWRKYCRILADTFDEIIEEFDMEILFIPNCTYNIDHKYEDDRFTHNDIVDMMKYKNKTHQIRGEYNLFETLSLYNLVDALFSNRRHSLIFAAVQSAVPIGCGGEWHVKPALDEIGVGDLFVKMEDFNHNTIKNSIRFGLLNKDKLLAVIMSKLPQLNALAKQSGKVACDRIK